MPTESLEFGHFYTRKKIRELLGGGELVHYLPGQDGRILAGCFVPGLNKRAPEEIDVGDGPSIIERAKNLAASQGKIPIFLKKRPNQWEYIGVYRCISFSQSTADLHAHPNRRNDAIGVLYFEKSGEEKSFNIPAVEALEASAREGKLRLVEHLRRERSRSLVVSKRLQVRREKGFLVCESCEKTENDFPADIGESCFEAHHLTPLSELTKETKNNLDDISLVCANCHRMIHRGNPILTPQGLKKKLNR